MLDWLGYQNVVVILLVLIFSALIFIARQLERMAESLVAFRSYVKETVKRP